MGLARACGALLAGGELMAPGGARRLQDPLSFRAVGTVHGAVAVALDRLHDAVVPELGAAADSPLVLGSDVVSTANFHGPALSQALDAAAIALAQAGDAAARASGPPGRGSLQRPARRPGRRPARVRGRAA